MGTIEQIVLTLEEKWNSIDKRTTASTLKQLINERFPGEDYSKVVATLTDTPNKNTVYSWFNMSREDVKIPFIKLCKLLSKLDVTMDELFATNNHDLNSTPYCAARPNHIESSPFCPNIPKGYLRCPFCGKYAEAISENWCLIQPVGDTRKYLSCIECEGLDGEYKY